MSEEILDEELNSFFVAPARSINGEELAPYTEGSRLLLLQVRTDEDSPHYFIWAFVFLHILLKRNKKEAVALAWKKELFKEKLFEWLETKKENDRDEAARICSEMVEEAGKSRPEIIGSKNGGTEGKA